MPAATPFDPAEVLASARAYFEDDELAATTWMNTYALRNAEGGLLERSPEDMHRRMADEFARIEARHGHAPRSLHPFLSAHGRRRAPLTAEHILALFAGFRLLVPQGSIMAVLGDRHRLASLSNCVVLPSPHDSYGGILWTDQQLAQLCKRRCGVGFDLSTLRPEGAVVHNAARTSAGAAAFMERFSNTTREVAQQGRRGALMLTMDIAHPDVERFITMKQDLAKVTGANVSVRISDAFLRAVEADGAYRLRWPVDAERPVVEHTVRARDLWRTLVRCAHRTGEPGIILWDRQHTYSTSSVYPGFRNESTNPCSEIAMQGGDSCRLMALNLYGFVERPFTADARFDHETFARVTYEAQRLMDDLVDLEGEAVDRILAKVEADPEPEALKVVERTTWEQLRETGRTGRRTGLGFTGLADTLAALGMRYGEEASLRTVEDIMRTKCRAEFDSSIDLAIERGPFTGFDPEVERSSGFVAMMREEFPDVHARMMRHGRRNISLSTVAPTGTLSLLTRTSSGIEPVYSLSYTRRRKLSPGADPARSAFTDASGDRWEEFTVHHPGYQRWMSISGGRAGAGPYSGATAGEVDHPARLRLQALVQKYTTHSISSTINLPATATEEEVEAIYLQAWRLGLKGITVYREGCRSGVLLGSPGSGGGPVIERPERLDADILRFSNGTMPWIAVVSLHNGLPWEIFTGRADAGPQLPEHVRRGAVVKRTPPGAVRARYDLEHDDVSGGLVTLEGLNRSFGPEARNYAVLISGLLRHGVPLPHVVAVVADLDLYDASLNTWKSGVVRALQRYIPEGTGATGTRCPGCGAREGGYCAEGFKCASCGGSICG